MHPFVFLPLESKHHKERKERKTAVAQQQQLTPVKVSKRRAKRQWTQQSSSSEGEGGDDSSEVTQCYGPLCTQPARPKSKYCSDACGIKLASTRIYRVSHDSQEYALFELRRFHL